MCVSTYGQVLESGFPGRVGPRGECPFSQFPWGSGAGDSRGANTPEGGGGGKK